MFFLDPTRGRTRRRLAIDRPAGAVRHARKRIRRETRFRAASARGRAHRIAHALRCSRREELDDATLAHKVGSVVFRDRRLPKGDVNVNAENGVVVLRGEVASRELIDELEHAVRAVGGVSSVENLLHLPVR